MTKKVHKDGTQESLDFIIKHMATKSDIKELTTTLDEHTKILGEHTNDLNTIKNDVKTGLDKRLQLNVRVVNIEKHLGFKKPTTV